MAQMIAAEKVKAIIGTGATGLSVARFCLRMQQPFVLFDTRKQPPALAAIQQEFPTITLELGPLSSTSLMHADEIIVSPGINVAEPAIVAAQAAGVAVIGDIELFARYARAPIVAITGSNAKSTVTTLVGEMAKAADINVAVGGNLGTPALDLLDDQVELYVMELSSFQLETVTRLAAKVACILNVSPDHLDRYPDMDAYHAAKLRVYNNAEQIVFNRKDLLTQPPLVPGVKPITFGGPAARNHFGVIENTDGVWLAWEFQPLINANELLIRGKHNIDNALAALALGYSVGIPMPAMLATLKQFRGLAHRCEWVKNIHGIDFFNDSKGTNVGATIAAIHGLARTPAQLVLIAGGEAKGAEFSSLAVAISGHVRAVVLIGKDAPVIAAALSGIVPLLQASTLENAVTLAYNTAQPGDAVLLSPACASLDMFKNYMERGEQFCHAVEALAS